MESVVGRGGSTRLASGAPVEPRPRPARAGLGEVAVRGVVTLGMREGAMKILAFVGDVALYRLLTPADFGVIVPIAFLAGMVKQFADVGLQPSLIQRKDEPGRDDLRAVFTVQLGLVLVAAALVFIAGPIMVEGLLEGAADPWMIRVFALSILLSAFRLVPAALLERHLRFGRLSAADIGGTLWYYGAGIGFAIAAFNVWSLVIAHVGASIAATVLVMAAQPWRPFPSLRVSAIRPYINFGAQFQGARLALMLKDALIPLYAPRVFGVTATGLLAWADKIASQPLMFTQLVARVSLPAFSRIQDDPDRVRQGAELTLKWNALLTLPAFAAVVAYAPEIARFIYSDQWTPAVPALYVLALNAVLVPINGLITPILNALGKTRLVLMVAIGWVAIAWMVAVLLAVAGVGMLAIPIALAVSQFAAALVLVPLAWHVFHLRLLRHLGKPLLAAVLAGVVGRFALLPLLTDAVLLVQGGILVVIIYTALIYVFDGRALRAELGALIHRRAGDL